MRRRTWIIAGMVLSIPGLFFTFMLGLAALFHLLLVIVHAEWWVENRTGETVWVTPLLVNDRGPARLRPYATAYTRFSDSPSGEVQIEPGQRIKLVIDEYDASDIGGPAGLVVRTAAGEHRHCNGTHDGQSVVFMLDDLANSRRASDQMIAEVQRRLLPPFFGIPIWVIFVLGIAAPISLLVLRRAYQKAEPMP